MITVLYTVVAGDFVEVDEKLYYGKNNGRNRVVE